MKALRVALEMYDGGARPNREREEANERRPKRRRPICKITTLTRFLFHPFDRKNHRRFGFQFESMFKKMKLPTTRAARLAVPARALSQYMLFAGLIISF